MHVTHVTYATMKAGAYYSEQVLLHSPCTSRIRLRQNAPRVSDRTHRGYHRLYSRALTSFLNRRGPVGRSSCVGKSSPLPRSTSCGPQLDDGWLLEVLPFRPLWDAAARVVAGLWREGERALLLMLAVDVRTTCGKNVRPCRLGCFEWVF